MPQTPASPIAKPMPEPATSSATSSRDGTAQIYSPPVYRPAARALHWLTVAFVVVMVPVGVVMTERAEHNIWDGLTNALYSSHKLAGIVLLLLVVVRLAYRLVHGAPPDEPTLAPWHKIAGTVVHWTMYGLLLLVPVLGWIGISRYPALDIFGLFSLPGLVAPNQKAADAVFMWHKFGAFALVALIGLHLVAVLHRHFVRRDGVLQRMLPGLKPRA